MFRDEILALLTQVPNAAGLLETPPDPALGDYALPCFPLAKERQKAPNVIAQEIAAGITAPFLEKVLAKGPYVNFFIDRRALGTRVLSRTSDPGFGKGKEKGEKVMIEYSQPNTHKAFHIGHLRGTSLGEALARILRFAGFEVVQANYSGDTGAHIAKWLWHFQRHPSEPPADPQEIERWIASIYVAAVKALQENPEGEAQVQQLLTQLDDDPSPELKETYERTKKLSIEAFERIYAQLHAHFDVWWFESEVEERGKEIARELVEKGIAKVDDGATIVDLEDESLGIWVLLRKGGTALYSAKDLALAEKKFSEFHIDRSVYVIGAAQSMHMQQLFATLKRMDFPNTEKCHHLSYTEVRLPEGKMSSRTGQNILYADIREEVRNYARSEVRSRHPDWPEAQIDGVADKVTIAALKWDMLAIHPNKTIVFDPKRATQFEGETGPYLQYTFARASSILAKVQADDGAGSTLLSEKEQALLKTLAGFPRAIERASEGYRPGDVANYAMQLAKTFNSFYHECPVAQAEGDVKADRLALVRASARILGACLDLLGIDAPEAM